MKTLILKYWILLLLLFCIANDSFGQGRNIFEFKKQNLAIQQKDSCDRWHAWSGIRPPQSQEVYKMILDTLKHYIKSCTTDDSHDVFSSISRIVQEYPTGDTARYDLYREWLISVLYLNTTDPYYFCADLQAVMGTYGFGKWHIPNAGLAIIKYLQSNPNCNSQGLQDLYDESVRSRHDTWLSGDRKTPEDTTLPSLDKLGLGFLLQNEVHDPKLSSSDIYLSSFTSSPNPFLKETTLEFELNRMAYTTIAIYDELGRLVWGDGKGSSLEAGKHTVHLEGSILPHGVLYARISTGFGEVKTVKLVHE